MSDLLPAGGLNRKLWSGDRAAYRDHLLRLDPASRHSRFGGGVSDDFMRNYVALSKNLDTIGFATAALDLQAQLLKPA